MNDYEYNFQENEEFLCDNHYFISVSTAIFAFLVDHLNEDYVEITWDKVDAVRTKFINGGKMTHFAFSPSYFISWMNNNSQWIIEKNGKWLVNVKKMVEGWENLGEEELEFVGYNSYLAKTFCLFCNLQIDNRILYDKYVANSIGLTFMYTEPHCKSDLIKTNDKIKVL